MSRSVKHASSCWLVAFCSLAAVGGAGRLGGGLCWLLGAGGGRCGRVGESMSADHVRYKLFSEAEQGRMAILRDLETLPVLFDDTADQPHANYLYASEAHFRIGADNLQRGIFEFEQLAEWDLYLSV